jgi:hypothetical protein
MSKKTSLFILLLSLIIFSLPFGLSAFAAHAGACAGVNNCTQISCSGWSCKSSGPPGECDGWCSCESPGTDPISLECESQ